MNEQHTTSDLELQLWLAKQLPKEVEYDPTETTPFWWREDQYRFVTPREWDYIVRRVEEKLTDDEAGEYVEVLTELSGADVEAGSPSFVAYFTSWQTRTIALMKVKGEAG